MIGALCLDFETVIKFMNLYLAVGILGLVFRQEFTLFTSILPKDSIIPSIDLVDIKYLFQEKFYS